MDEVDVGKDVLELIRGLDASVKRTGRAPLMCGFINTSNLGLADEHGNPVLGLMHDAPKWTL